MITIKDVAKLSGLSPTTVSFVLSRSPLARSIPPKTKSRIKRIARQVGYRPNSFARALRSKRSRTVGIMVSDLRDPYFAEILSGIENSLYRSAYTAIVTDIQNGRGRLRRYIDLLMERRVDGVITIANSLILETDQFSIFDPAKVPVVIIGRESEAELSSVVIDNEGGARTAMEHLSELGHREFAFIKGPKKVVDSRQRWAGIRSFCQEASLKIDPRLVVEISGQVSSYEAGYGATKALLRKRQPFTALVAFDDMTAFGAIRGLEEMGLNVPQDCSVIGFDDVAAAAFYNPPLTTVHQPLENLGSIAADIFKRAARASIKNAPFKAEHRMIAPRLVVRKSTCARGTFRSTDRSPTPASGPVEPIPP
jgi:LacI family transcriptional regulator